MKHTKRRILSLLLALFMVIGLVPGQVFAADPESSTLADGTYYAEELKFSTGMWHTDPADFTNRVEVKDGKITLVARAYDPSKYDAVWMGKRADAPADAATAEVITGKLIEADEAYIADGALKNNIYEAEDGKKYKAVEFEIPLTEADLTAEAVYFVLRYSNWYTNSEGDTSKRLTWMGKNDNSFTVGALTKVTELEITNNINMFKLVSATAYTAADGSGKVVFALSGTGYHYLYKGTYEQAAANGEARDKWIAGAENAEKKWEFELPIEAGESYIPVVAISQSYLDKHDQGQNTLERAFYPRQLTLDLEAKTIVADDYKYTKELKVTNNVKMFKVSSAVLHTVGGPNSNNYKSEIILTMGSSSFDEAFIGTQIEAEEAAETIAIGEDFLCPLTVKWVENFGDPESLQSLAGEPFTVSFHSVKNDAWYERIFTLDEGQLTLVIDESPAADYTAVDEAIAAAEALDPELYTDESMQALNEAIDAVVRGRYANAQDEVDAMAAAINAALEGLEEKELEYVFDADTAGSWVIGSGKDFEFTVHRNMHDEETFERYEGMSIDGKELGEEACSAEAGSLKGTIKAEYLETLSEGDHKLVVSFNDGEAEFTFRVQTATAPGTGDDSARFYIFAVLTFAMLVALYNERRRYHE